MRLQLIAAALLAATAAAAVHAAPAARAIALADGVDTLIVPATAPLRYRSTGAFDVISFSGRFVLTGVFHYGCEYDCDEPDREFSLYIVPDTAQQSRLPHWSKRSGKVRVYIIGDEPLIRAAISRRPEMAQLRAGRLDEITGRMSIIVDNYTASIECDAPSYVATFVALAKPLQVAALPADDHGC